MFNNKTIAVVIPAYNEEKQILLVLEKIPEFVDRIVVVNDCSTDKTVSLVSDFINKNNSKVDYSYVNKIPQGIHNRAEIILQNQEDEELKLFPAHIIMNDKPENDRIILINNTGNYGVGATIAIGYKWCKDHHIDCTAVMAGDNQMDPDELITICKPVIEEGIDYVKGNRLIHRSALLIIPKVRYFGNSILSILTKIASGYWHASDTQTGYTAISLKALQSIRLHKIYKGYGVPNDILVKLNIAFCTLKEVEIKPIYQVGEKSKMKMYKVIPKISWLLFKSFFRRLWIKYLFRDFHPLFLLYHLSFFLGIIALPYIVKIIRLTLAGREASPLTVLALMFLIISSFQSLLFAMWMDIQDNDRLYKL